MKSKYLYLLLFIFPFILNAQIAFTSASSSQVYDGRANASEWDYRFRDALTDMRYNTNRTFSDSEKKYIIGNSYYNKIFISGNILYENKVASKVYALRYNAFRDEIEVSNGDKIEYVTRDPKISCIIGIQKYTFQPFLKNKKTKVGYLVTIYQGKDFTLFERKVKKYKAEKKAKNSLTTSIPAKIVDVAELYFSNSKRIATYVKPKKKVLLEKIAVEQRSKMNTFIKKINLI
ncbi:hypothetical protein Lupro_05145 [Lutibacter profundi]|uniref:DUF4468 domain-containing protein n=1 Tax=Lutibacter profundi TaxID=1622118 RepID=A0A0X8G5Z7_9FLAO|nr:hypothetical protein [Lutibacter profundi]AMC10665.1 hypothetical protein Lupro_05145 [Lutibacter profundi]